MPKKSWIDKAAESCDWSDAEKQARRLLGKSGAQIRESRQTQDREKIIAFGEGEEPNAMLGLDALDRVEELVEDENDDALPSDEEEGALTATDTQPVVTLSMAYDAYLARGGNRRLPGPALAHLGSRDVTQIDRATVIAAALKLYPKHSPQERAELLYDPLSEVLGGNLKALAPAPVSNLVRRNPGPHKSWAEQRAEYERERAEYYDRLEKIWDMMEALAVGDYALARKLGWKGERISEEEQRRRWAEYDNRMGRHGGTWARVSNFQLPSSPS